MMLLSTRTGATSALFVLAPAPGQGHDLIGRHAAVAAAAPHPADEPLATAGPTVELPTIATAADPQPHRGGGVGVFLPAFGVPGKHTHAAAATPAAGIPAQPGLLLVLPDGQPGTCPVLDVQAEDHLPPGWPLAGG